MRRAEPVELALLTTDLAKDLELSAARSIARVSRLRREAHVHALAQHYGLADSLAREAEVHRADVLLERQRALHAQYADRQQKLIARHRAFEASFDAKLQDDIDQLRLEFRRTLAFYRQRVAAQAIGMGLEVVEEELAALFATHEFADAGAAEPPLARARTAASPRLFDPRAAVPRSGLPLSTRQK